MKFISTYARYTRMMRETGKIAFLVLPILIASIGYLQAQSIVISKDANANAAGSAILDVQSTEKGMLVPRMTQAQRNAISSPGSGLLIYQTDNTPGFYYYSGSAWEALRAAGITSETDPQVGTIATDFVPRWDGSKLISGVMREKGTRIGIDKDPDDDFKLDVAGTINADAGLWGGDLEIGDNAFINNNLDVGSITAYDESDFGQVNVGSLNSTGSIQATNLSGGLKAYMNTQNEVGHIETFGSNGLTNFIVTFLSGYPNNGYMAVRDDEGGYEAGMYVDGATGDGVIFGDRIQAAVKNFVVDHPNDPSREIVYASLEGPEAAMYTRGTAQLVNGQATIVLPEHFRLMAVESSMTVTVTPLSENSNGLAITSKNLNGIIVKELMRGDGTYAFDWEVRCVRKGYEDYQVVRDKAAAGGSSIAPFEPSKSSTAPEVVPRERRYKQQ
jgi:hypothetical protein